MDDEFRGKELRSRGPIVLKVCRTAYQYSWRSERFVYNRISGSLFAQVPYTGVDFDAMIPIDMMKGCWKDMECCTSLYRTGFLV